MALDGGVHQPPGCFISAACWSPIGSDILIIV